MDRAVENLETAFGAVARSAPSVVINMIILLRQNDLVAFLLNLLRSCCFLRLRSLVNSRRANTVAPAANRALPLTRIDEKKRRKPSRRKNISTLRLIEVEGRVSPASRPAIIATRL
jgi:hypothetical protein